jgi:hypothetical protein
MVDISQFGQYFPSLNNPIKEGIYEFKIILREEDEYFNIDLKITQEDSREENLIKLRLGMGKHNNETSLTHNAQIPHFEINCYNRKEDGPFVITLYFDFENINEEILIKNIKGTIVLIKDFIETFLDKKKLNPDTLDKLVYRKIINEELLPFKQDLINNLCACFKNKNLTARIDGKSILINTSHNLEKFMNIELLNPIYLPLKENIDKT